MEMVTNHPLELENVLEPGETILWSARPDPWFYARPTFMLYIVALPWTIFTFGWLNAITDGFHLPQKIVAPIPWWTPWMAIGAGFILLVAGLWMLSAPFWIWREGKGTIHALTNRRALVLDTRNPKKKQGLTLEGKVNFRITNPGEKVSDLDVLCGAGRGLLFRAVKSPQDVVGQWAKTGWN